MQSLNNCIEQISVPLHEDNDEIEEQFNDDDNQWTNEYNTIETKYQAHDKIPMNIRMIHKWIQYYHNTMDTYLSPPFGLWWFFSSMGQAKEIIVDKA